MKTNKLMLAALMVGTLAMVGCKNNEKEPDPVIPNPGTQTEEIEGTDGAVTLVVDLADAALTTTTTDIYFVGKYKDAEGVEYSWDPSPAGSLKMTKLTDKRYKLVLYPTDPSETTCNETGEDVKVQCVIAGKATLLDEKKTWGYCWQYTTVSATGDYQLRAENSSEWRLVVEESDPLGGVVYVTVKGWNGDPTAQAYSKVVFNLEIKGEDQDSVFLHGPFVDESWNGVQMTKVSANHFTYTVEKDIMPGTEYQYTLASTNWDAKAIFEEGGTAGSGNQKINAAEMNDVVYGFAE